VNIAYIPSRCAFEVCAAREHTTSNAKDLLFRRLMSLCVSRNYMTYYPKLDNYTRWKLWRITALLNELRLKNKSVRFSLHMRTTEDECSSNTAEVNNPTKTEEHARENFPKACGSNDFEIVESLFENGSEVSSLYILLQTSDSIQDLEAAHQLLAEALSFSEDNSTLQGASQQKEGKVGVTVKQTSNSMCCMCRRQVLEQNMWRKSAEKEGRTPGSLSGWRLTLCGCVFCRTCFVNSVSLKLKRGTTAQCQRCSASVLAKDCLKIVKPHCAESFEKEAFERDWKMLSMFSTYNFCNSMIDTRGECLGCALCNDCQTITVYTKMKPFFACRNSRCSNIMCINCQQVPLTAEEFELCRKQNCCRC